MTRRTNFNPDQTAVTAQTFTSTNPAARPMSRTMCSVRSVGTPELFLGQLTQSMPAGVKCFEMKSKSSRSSLDFANHIMKSTGYFRPRSIVHLSRAVFSSARTSAGIPDMDTRFPGLIPSFLGSGVPEYPGIANPLERSITTKDTKVHEGNCGGIIITGLRLLR